MEREWMNNKKQTHKIKFPLLNRFYFFALSLFLALELMGKQKQRVFRL